MKKIRMLAFSLCMVMILNIAVLGVSAYGTTEEQEKIEVRVYPSVESIDYVQYFYAEGETVDISKWEIPEMYYEGEPMVFDCWMDEILKNKITENFVMGSQSLAFYATYSSPQIFSWSAIEGEEGAYVSDRAGVKVIKELGEAQYGTVSADFTNVKKNGGLIFNATLSDENYPFEKGCAYWYVHVNPSNGKTQLALVDYINNNHYKSINIMELEDSPAAWQEKVVKLNNGVEDSYNLKVEFGKDAISYYIDGNLFYTYTGSYLGALSGTGVGVRAAGFGNVAKNISLTPIDYSGIVRLYEAEDSNTYTELTYQKGDTVDISKWIVPEYTVDGVTAEFLGWVNKATGEAITENFVIDDAIDVYADWDFPQLYNWDYDAETGTYTSNGFGVIPLAGIEGAAYGTLSADFVNVSANGGFIFNATLTDVDYPAEAGQQYWYTHINPKSGGTQLACVTATSETTSKYGSIKIVALADSAQSWQDKVAAHNAGTKASYNLKVEFMPDRISYYIDDNLCYTYTGDKLNTLNGTTVGLRAAGAGNTVKNVTFTPASTEQETVLLCLYEAEGGSEYTELTYKKGDTVDISEWQIPEYTVNGKTGTFTNWINKATGEAITENFVISEAMDVYAEWDFPQLYNWDYDAETGTYTSNGFGVIPLVGIEGAAYGTLSADFVNVSANGGFIFNATLTDIDYPAEAGQQYWYTHINPKSGATQLACVTATSETTSKYGSIKIVALADSAQSWKDKVAAHNAGTKASYNLKVEFMPDRISYYVDDNLCYTYTGNKLNTLDGITVGLRAAGAGNTVKNVTFTPASNTTLSNLPIDEGVSLMSLSDTASYSITDDKVIYKAKNRTEDTVNTFEAWIKLPSSIADNSKCGVIFGNAISLQSVNFHVEKGGHFAVAWNNGLSNYTFSSVDLRNDEWTHIAFVRDDANEKLYYYVNGQLKETIDADIADIASFSKFVAGSDQSYGQKQNPFKGEIKQITIYSEPQNAETIALDMANANITTADRGNALLSNWYFTEKWGSLEVVADTSANENDFVFSTYNKYVPVEDFGDYDYAFAVIPDIQIMTNYKPEKLIAQSQWLVDNAEKLNIKFAMYMGDLTDYTWTVNSEISERNWDDAKKALSILDGKLPYTFVPGNHDYTSETKTNRDTTLFDEHFPYEKYCTADSFVRAFEDGLMTNTCHLFEVGDVKYLVLCLEFGPRTIVLNWADRMICENKDARVIVTTHSYMDVDGELTEADDAGNVKNYNSYENVNTGTEMWEKIFSKHENVFLTFSGHVNSNDILCKTQTGDNGNTVRNFLVDLQNCYDHEGKAIDVFMLVKVNETEKTMSYCYYSPANDMCYNVQNQYIESISDANNPTVGIPYDANKDGVFDFEDVLFTLKAIVNGENLSLLKVIRMLKRLVG